MSLVFTEEGSVDARSIASDEPLDVSQVVSAQHNPNDTYSLKTAFGKYVSCDKVGILSALSDAIGPQEEWSFIQREDGWALMSKYDNFLSIEEETLTVRGDATSIGFRECFRIKMQRRFRSERREKEVAEKRKRVLLDQQERPVDEKALESDMVRRYQSWTNNRVQISKEDMEDVKKAKLEGNLHQVLLDRRSKLKSDKFCT